MIDSMDDPKTNGQYQPQARHKMSSPLITMSKFQMSSHIQPSFKSHTDPSEPEFQSFHQYNQTHQPKTIQEREYYTRSKTPSQKLINQQQETPQKCKPKVPSFVQKLQMAEDGLITKNDYSTLSILQLLTLPLLKSIFNLFKIIIRLLVQLTLAKKGKSIDQFNYVMSACTFFTYAININQEIYCKSYYSSHQRLNIQQLFSFFLIEISLLLLEDIPVLAYALLYVIVSFFLLFTDTLAFIRCIEQKIKQIQLILGTSQICLLKYIFDLTQLIILISYFIYQQLQDPLLLSDTQNEKQTTGYYTSVLISFQLLNPMSTIVLESGISLSYDLLCGFAQFGGYFFHLLHVVNLIKTVLAQNNVNENNFEAKCSFFNPFERFLLHFNLRMNGYEGFNVLYHELIKKMIVKALSKVKLLKSFKTQFYQDLAELTSIYTVEDHLVPNQSDIFISINGRIQKIMDYPKVEPKLVKNYSVINTERFFQCQEDTNFQLRGQGQVLKFNIDQFLKLMKSYPIQQVSISLKPKEIYHYLRHLNLFQGDKSLLELKCKCCGEKTHNLKDCPWLTYRPDKKELINQYLHSSKQRRIQQTRKIRKFNARKQLNKIGFFYENQGLRISRRSYTGFSRASGSVPKVQIKSDDEQILSERLNLRDIWLKYSRQTVSIQENSYLSPKPNNKRVCDWNTIKQNSLAVNTRQNPSEDYRRQKEFRQQNTDLAIVKERNEEQIDKVKGDLIQSLSLSSINLNNLNFHRESMPEAVYSSQLENNPFISQGTQNSRIRARSTSSPKHLREANVLSKFSETSTIQIDEMAKFTHYFPEFNYDIVIQKVNKASSIYEQSMFDCINSKE